MKRFLAIVLAGLMLISLVACGGKDDVVKSGLLEISGSHNDHEGTVHADRHKDMGDNEYVYYSNLSAALMDLEAGNINVLALEESFASYVVARNKNLTFETMENSGYETSFSMMTLDSKKEVYDILNDTIKAMKEDGTLANLIEKDLKAYIESDPEAKELPRFDGAITIKIGVTGDLPPMDYVATNGKAAGFNIALLTEIANRAQVNFELVQIESGARPMALSSGKVDAVFWAKGFTCTECDVFLCEEIAGTLVTESYFSDYNAVVTLKSDK